ncbi:MAG: hypothetical protein ACJ734_07800 [Gaiellaceae bacterium]
MKKQVIALVALFAAGVVASFAVAAPPPGKGHNTSSSGSTTTTSHGKSGDHAKAKCRPMNLKGTVAGGTIAVSVTKAAGPQGKTLVGTTANLTIKGSVNAQVWSCATAGSSAAPQLTLRQLHVGGSPQAATTTTP